MPKKSSMCGTDHTLPLVEVALNLINFVEGHVNLGEVLLLCRVDIKIIKEHFNKNSQVWSIYHLHETLKGGKSINEPK